MAGPTLYITFPGNAREALVFYAEVFGGVPEFHTFEDFSRTDGPATSIAHGMLLGGPVALYASDTGAGEPSVAIEGAMLALLGAAEPDELHTWFDRLAEGGTILDPLAPKPWGASDGQVIDRYGLRWLIGYEPKA